MLKNITTKKQNKKIPSPSPLPKLYYGLGRIPLCTVYVRKTMYLKAVLMMSLYDTTNHNAAASRAVNLFIDLESSLALRLCRFS